MIKYFPFVNGTRCSDEFSDSSLASTVQLIRYHFHDTYTKWRTANLQYHITLSLIYVILFLCRNVGCSYPFRTLQFFKGGSGRRQHLQRHIILACREYSHGGAKAQRIVFRRRIQEIAVPRNGSVGEHRDRGNKDYELSVFSFFGGCL